MAFSRELERIVHGVPTSDGAGVKLLRVLTQDLQRRLDPFLMLDYFHSDNPDDYLAGFPDHPHRGFETVTYMLAGRMRHRDNAGHEGLLGPGGVQWMTAGRGIVHSELPEQEDGLMQGFQLWVNLPGKNKLAAPWYRDIPSDEIPVLTRAEGVTVKLIAGRLDEQTGAIERPDTEPLYLDVSLPAGSTFAHALSAHFNAFIYVYAGEVQIGELARQVSATQMGILTTSPQADQISLRAGDRPARLLLIAGQPLREPIVQWGPFVMNTQEEVMQAVADFRGGKF